MPGASRTPTGRARRALPAALLAAFAACGPAPPTWDLGRPPVVLIVLDALHADHVSHLGYERETTPMLDALAAEGVSFESAFAPAPYTLASIPSLLTGRRPDSHGVTSRLAALPESETTLAELLERAGYRTLGAVANLNGGPEFGTGQGFDELVELYVPGGEDEVDQVDRSGTGFHLPQADEFPPLVERWLAERGAGDGPPFLYLHVLEPHSPYTPPEPFRSRFLDPDYAGPYASGDTETLVRNKQGKLAADAADREAVRALYDGNLSWADHNLGRVLDLLRAAGLYDDALIAVTSDHGEALWQHGQWGHNEQLYDEMLRVPLVIKFPRGTPPAALAGQRPTALASILDLVPSLCEWLDLPVPPTGLDGTSLTPALTGVAPAGRELLLRTHHRIPHVGLRTATHKTIVHRHEQTGETTDVEYYWLEVDPEERNDLAERRAKEVGPNIVELEDWIRRATVNRARRDVPLTVMERRMLEKLGYVDLAEDDEASDPPGDQPGD